MSIFELLLPAFVAGLILTGIHAYLGVHVVERGVIFVDLSLAQIAALGTTVAYLAGHDLHSQASYLFSLAFTFVGAAIFALSRVHRRTSIPQEAIIGIVYAVSAALAILVMSKATQETEHLKEMLVGNILSVTWPELRCSFTMRTTVAGEVDIASDASISDVMAPVPMAVAVKYTAPNVASAPTSPEAPNHGFETNQRRLMR